MSRKGLIIFGTGSLARLAHFNFTQHSDYEVKGFAVSAGYFSGNEFLGLPVKSWEDVEAYWSPEDYEVFVAVGYTSVNQERARVYEEAKAKGYNMATYISPHATVMTDDIGDNVFIFENTIVQPFVHVGNNVVLWSCSICHDGIIGDHCFIASGAVTGGHCQVGAYSFLGLNATIRDQVRVGEGCVIGAGAWIHRDTADRSLYTTKPAQRYALPGQTIKI